MEAYLYVNTGLFILSMICGIIGIKEFKRTIAWNRRNKKEFLDKMEAIQKKPPSDESGPFFILIF